MYAVVLFTDEDDAPAVVPDSWLCYSDTKAFWPTCTKSRFGSEKLAKDLAEPQEDWELFNIRMLEKGIESYLEARRKCKQAEMYSDLEERQKREKVPTRRYEAGDVDEDRQTKKFKKCNKKISLKPPALFEHGGFSTSEPSTSSAPPVAPVVYTETEGGSQDLASINRKLSHLQSSVDSLGHMMARLSEQISGFSKSSAKEEETSQIMETFPLSNIDEFENLEESLKTASFQSLCIKVISLTGGTSTKNTLQNIMKKIFTDEVAILFSFKGQVEGKRSFCTSQLFKVVKYVVQKAYSDASDANIKNVVSEWLIQAKFRKNRKEERAKPKNVYPFTEEQVDNLNKENEYFSVDGKSYQIL